MWKTRSEREVSDSWVPDKHRRRQGPTLRLFPCTSPHAAAGPMGGKALDPGKEGLKAGTQLGEQGHKGPGGKLYRRFRKAVGREQPGGRGRVERRWEKGRQGEGQRSRPDMWHWVRYPQSLKGETENKGHVF